ncbi:PepSY domain-containing protein [Bosea sp. (in: a-proteobacteria)]
MFSRRSAMLAAMAGLAAVRPVLAQPSAPAEPPERAISMEEARRIATENGVARIETIAREGGQWKVEGRDSLGSGIEIELRASDGTVMKLERERPASARAGN